MAVNTAGKGIERFSKTARYTHWAHTLTFVVLFFTGMMLYADLFDFLLPLFGGYVGAMQVHRIAAVSFIIVSLLGLIANPSGFFSWIREILTWSKEDFAFVGRFTQAFFSSYDDIPRQGKFNGGEKLNSLFILMGSALLVLTGIVMWLPQSFSVQVVRAAYPVHDISMIVVSAEVIGHIFLAIFHPDNREALSGMLYGHVSEEYAKSHHAKWYEEQQNKALGKEN